MADPKDLSFRPAGHRASPLRQAQRGVFPDIKAAALRTSKSRGRDPIKAVNTVVIHATAGSSSAEQPR